MLLVFHHVTTSSNAGFFPDNFKQPLVFPDSLLCTLQSQWGHCGQEVFELLQTSALYFMYHTCREI